jgi:hypothetical protein
MKPLRKGCRRRWDAAASNDADGEDQEGEDGDGVGLLQRGFDDSPP